MAVRPMLNLSPSALALALTETAAPVVRAIEVIPCANGTTRGIERITPEAAREAILRLRGNVRVAHQRKLIDAFAKKGIAGDQLVALVSPPAPAIPEPAPVSFASFIGSVIAPTPVVAEPAFSLAEPTFTLAEVNALLARVTGQVSVMPESTNTPVFTPKAPKSPRAKSATTCFTERVQALAESGDRVRLGMRAAKLAKQDRLSIEDLDCLSDEEILAAVRQPIHEEDTLLTILEREGCI